MLQWVTQLGIKYFRGIYSRDNLPQKIHKLETGIINLDDSMGGGSHCVCYRNLDKQFCEYFDWFGLIKHSSIKMTPVEASKKKNESTVYYNLYGDMKQLSSKPKFKVGDKVRISKYKRKVFDKGYTPNWTEEIFLIDKIQSTNPITYRLKDLNNEEIQGIFYEQELLPAKQDVFRIEKVIRRDYKKKQALVKWVGYSDDFNSWIPLSNLQDLSN